MAKSYLDKDGLLYFLQLIRPNATPSMDGTAATGTAKRFALQDHVHPSDTTKAPLASPALTGTPTAPTATTGTTREPASLSPIPPGKGTNKHTLLC